MYAYINWEAVSAVATSGACIWAIIQFWLSNRMKLKINLKMNMCKTDTETEEKFIVIECSNAGNKTVWIKDYGIVEGKVLLLDLESIAQNHHATFPITLNPGASVSLLLRQEVLYERPKAKQLFIRDTLGNLYKSKVPKVKNQFPSKKEI